MIALPFKGKGAMVWTIRKWVDKLPPVGDEVTRLVADALSLGITHLAIKVVNGLSLRWEPGNPARQNDEYLDELVPALREAGIEPLAWGWTYGRSIYSPYADISSQEAALITGVVSKYGFKAYLIDAEHHYRRKGLGMDKVATNLASRLRAGLPDVALALCSYRYPITYQPDFPWASFMPFMDFHAPQVYWEEATSPTAPAYQLDRSYQEYKQLKQLPYVPVAPLYSPTSGWKPTAQQETNFLDTCIHLGLDAASIWCIDQAYQQGILPALEAWADFAWPGAGQPQPPTSPTAPIEDVVGEVVAWARGLGYTGPGLESG